MTYDILIRGGTVIDGSGAPGVAADVAIENGRIAAVGAAITGDAASTIDATGLAVTPGFIDIKTHSDFTLPINPKAESKVRQGVTTEIIGHCGFSVAPCLPGKVELLRDYLSPSAPWLPFRELIVSGLSRHVPGDGGQCRNAGRPQHAAADGDGHGPPARRLQRELDAMIALLEEGLEGRCARAVVGPLHVARLLRRAGRDDRARPGAEDATTRLYFTHLRDESANVLESVAGGDRRRRDVRRPCPDRALQVLRASTTGARPRTALDMLAAGPRPRVEDRLRRLSVRGRLQSAQEPDAAMGAGRRPARR